MKKISHVYENMTYGNMTLNLDFLSTYISLTKTFSFKVE